MGSVSLWIIIILCFSAAISSTKNKKTGKTAGRPTVSSINQTIQRAAMAAEPATARQRPTQHKDVVTNAGKYRQDEEMNHVAPVRETRNQQMQAKEMQVKETPIPKVPLAKAETAQGDIRMLEIQDLMIKGYDGKLTFERDFISEGIEMLNRIQIQKEDEK